MLLDEGMDTGPLLASEHLTIDTEETYETLVHKVHEIGPRLLTETLKRFEKGEIIHSNKMRRTPRSRGFWKKKMDT